MSGSSCSEVYFGDYRLLPARSPNIDQGWGVNKNIAQKPWHKVAGLLKEDEKCKKGGKGFTQTCPPEDKDGFIYNKTNPEEFSIDWKYINQTEVLVFHSWIAEYAKISNISEEKGQPKVMFQEPLKHAAIGDWPVSGAYRYLIYNNLALLDKPGEYVCVVDGKDALFSFIPPDVKKDKKNNPKWIKKSINKNRPVMSNLTTILSITRSINITLHGLKFQHTSSKGKDGYNYKDGAVTVLNAENIDINNCEFSHAGILGLQIRTSTNVVVEQSVFWDIGFHSILAQTRDVRIANNYFDGCGISRFWATYCIVVLGIGKGKSKIYVVNNEVTNSALGGIMAKNSPHGANVWEDKGFHTGVIEPTRDDYMIHVEFNHVHDFGEGLLSDFGAIKTGTNFVCNGAHFTVLDNNCHAYIHVYNNRLHDGQAYHNGANLMYSDASSSRNTFENNIMYGSGSVAMKHHCGVDNVDKNNIVHRTATSHRWHPMEQFLSGCEKNYPEHFQQQSSFNNIYLFENSEDFEVYKKADRTSLNETDFHKNLYWSPNEQEKNSTIFPGYLNWSDWKNLTGNDVDSVWADPLLQDPSSGLYNLGKDSPAWNLGMTQIQDNFGIEKNITLFYKK